MVSLADSVVLGRAALSRAEWAEARVCFERAAATDPESAEALDGLSDARWWLGEWHESRELKERAFVRYRVLGAHRQAASAAIWLANEHLIAHGNRAAWNGWLERAASLLSGLPLCVEQGWLLFSRGRRVADPEEMAAACRQVLEVARSTGDIDLEIVALSQFGRALVAQGRVAEGFARLDEAMAAVTAGEQRNFYTVCETCCNMLTTCEGAVEMERLAQWCRVTDEVSKRLSGLTLFSFCRLNYASVLLALGRLEEAEQTLLAGHEVALRGYPSFAAQLLMKLAEIRVVQGRVEEATELLAGQEENAAAVRPLARLLLARGEPQQVVNLLTRRLSLVSKDSMQAAPLYALLTEACLAIGDVNGAGDAARELSALAVRSERGACLAAAEYATGLVALAEGDVRAWVHFESALGRFTAFEMPLEMGRARLGMARALASTDASSAIEMARRARAEFERLGAPGEVARSAELLRQLGVGTGPGRRTEGVLSEREREVLSCLSEGLSNLEIGKRLFISPKTVEHHVGKILNKLGLKNRSAAAAYALKQHQAESAPK